MAHPSDRKPRILFDLSTSLQWRGRNAVGIVRTERELAMRLLGDTEVDVVPVVFHEKTLRALEPGFATELVAPIESAVRQNLSLQDGGRSRAGRGATRALRLLVGRIFRGAARIARFFARLALKVCPSLIREEMRQCLILIRQALKKLLFRILSCVVSAPPEISEILEQKLDLSLVVRPLPGDVLFIVGLGWNVLDCAALSHLKRTSGMAIATVSYDFIPTKFPQYLGGNPADYFYNYFLHMIDLSDFCFCISECTKRDFLEFCTEVGRTPPDTEVLYLGSGLIVPPDAGEISGVLRERLGKGRYALAVGTFEIRKNYGLLLSLWDELLKDPAFDLDLVIVGMPGWNADELIAKLETSPYLGTRILWFRNMSDAGLSWLYENCQVFLFPSFYEGWGLPVVEALQHGRPAIVSNRGSVPEAGLGVATILDIDHREAWMREIRKHAGPERSVLQKTVTPPSWDETACVAKDRLVELVNNQNGN